MNRVSPAAFDLITRFETGGRAYYNARLSQPNWPGGSSGVTIGFGYDLGYETTLQADWGQIIVSPAKLDALARCQGKTGSAAKQALSGVRDIQIAWPEAASVFADRTLPEQVRKTRSAFPGASELLPADAFGALVSLVFNRGTAMDGDRRTEMRSIRRMLADAAEPGATITTSGLCIWIAQRVSAMKRLWKDNRESDGDLYDRRVAEAALIKSAADQRPGYISEPLPVPFAPGI